MRTPRGLLAITPGEARDGAAAHALVRQIGAAFEAGLRSVSIREPLLSDAQLFELVRVMCELASSYDGSWVAVHDSVHVALAAGADGVHLGFRSLPPSATREVVGERLAIGFSAHARDAADGAEIAAADYLTFGPVRETPSKADLIEATGFEALSEFVQAAPRPVLALGGLGPEHVAAALAAGAAGVAGIRSVFGVDDTARATTDFLAAFEAEPFEATDAPEPRP
jgi:thiamine-phosphate pyrophosphorylase